MYSCPKQEINYNLEMNIKTQSTIVNKSSNEMGGDSILQVVFIISFSLWPLLGFANYRPHFCSLSSEMNDF